MPKYCSFNEGYDVGVHLPLSFGQDQANVLRTINRLGCFGGNRDTVGGLQTVRNLVDKIVRVLRT